MTLRGIRAGRSERRHHALRTHPERRSARFRPMNLPTPKSEDPYFLWGCSKRRIRREADLASRAVNKVILNFRMVTGSK